MKIEDLTLKYYFLDQHLKIGEEYVPIETLKKIKIIDQEQNQTLNPKAIIKIKEKNYLITDKKLIPILKATYDFEKKINYSPLPTKYNIKT